MSTSCELAPRWMPQISFDIYNKSILVHTMALPEPMLAPIYLARGHTELTGFHFDQHCGWRLPSNHHADWNCIFVSCYDVPFGKRFYGMPFGIRFADRWWWNSMTFRITTPQNLGQMRAFTYTFKQQCVKTSTVLSTFFFIMMTSNFPRYWLFVRGIHRSPVNSPHKGQWRGAVHWCFLWSSPEQIVG